MFNSVDFLCSVTNFSFLLCSVFSIISIVLCFFSVNNSGGYRNTDIRCIANDMMSDKKHESFIMFSIYENEPTLCCQNVTARNKNTGNDVVLKLGVHEGLDVLRRSPAG